MKQKLLSLIVLAFCVFFFNKAIHASDGTAAKGDPFPAATLSVPEKENEKEYLGLKGKGQFDIAQIKAELLIIEIYSMYCPYCQKEAPTVNKLYELINGREDIRDRIKLIAIGAGNTPFEVDIFRKQYNVRFPLFPDESFAIHKKIGEVRTPYFFVLKMNPDGSNILVYSKVGSIQDAGQFLEMILKESGLQ